MKRSFRSLVFPGFLALAMILLMASGSPESATKWTYFGGFQELGISWTINPPPTSSGPVEVGFTTPQDIQVSTSLTDASGVDLSAATTLFRDGNQWEVDIDFPQYGAFTLTLFGKLRSTAGNTYKAIASTVLTSTVDTAASVRYFPAFSARGLSLSATPPRDVGDQVVFTISSKTPLSYSAYLENTDMGEVVNDAAQVVPHDGGADVKISFPQSGAYRLLLSARASSSTAAPWEAVTLARFTATVALASTGAPANWSVGPAYSSFGVTVSSSSEQEVTDEAEIVINATKSFDLAFNLVNRTTGKDASSGGGQPVAFATKGNEAHVVITFPEEGNYELRLGLAAPGTRSYQTLALVKFTVMLSPAPQLPPNWSAQPAFKQLKLSLVSSSPQDAGSELSAVLTVPQGFKGSADLQGAAGTPQPAFATQVTGTEMRITALFRKSGDYTLTVNGTADPNGTSRTLASAKFTATVDPSQQLFYWLTQSNLTRIPASQVKNVTQDWEPMGIYSAESSYLAAVLTTDLSIPYDQGSVTFAKGATVKFVTGYSDGSSVRVIQGPLAQDAALTVYDASLVLKAGTTVAADSRGLSGAASQDTKLTIWGNTLLAPKGSNLVLRYGKLTEGNLVGKASLTVGKQVYECAGIFFVEDYYPGKVPFVRVVPTKPYAFKLGTRSFTLPAGSQLMFQGQSVARVVFVKDTKVTDETGTQTILAGWGLEYDSQGNATKFQAE